MGFWFIGPIVQWPWCLLLARNLFVNQLILYIEKLGVCIAERNKFLFFNFVTIQFIEVLWASIKTFNCLTDECEGPWIDQNFLNLVGLLAEFFFCIMVGSLVFYHAYLISINLTTCKFYFKLIKKSSPFFFSKITTSERFQKKIIFRISFFF